MERKNENVTEVGRRQWVTTYEAEDMMLFYGIDEFPTLMGWLSQDS